MRAETAAIVLAGGSGRRLAGDSRAAGGKPRVVVGGRTLLEHVCAAADLVAARIVAVGDPQPPVPAESLADSTPGAGPLAALADGLRLITAADAVATTAVILSCDVPLVRPAVLGRLVRLSREREGVWVVPRVDGRLEPLVSAADPARLLPWVERRLAAGARDLMGLCRQLAEMTPPGMVELDAAALVDDDPQRLSFFDVDTPEALDRLLARGIPPSPP